MPNQNIVIQVAKVEERLSALGGEIRDDVREIKISQDKQWEEFCRHERLMTAMLNEAKEHRAELKFLVISNKKHCDDRFESIEKDAKRADFRYKVKLSLIATLVAGPIAILTSLGVEAAKAHWGLG